MSSLNVIRPCTAQFHPQMTVKRVVTQATADTLYFLSGVHLYAMNAGTGALRWCLLVSDARSRLSLEGAEPGAQTPQRVASPAGRTVPRMGHQPDGLVGMAVQNYRVFVTSMHRFTFAFAAESGQLLWEHNTGGDNILTVFGDTLYVPSGGIYALSTHDGSEQWSYPTKDGLTSTPVIGDDTLYAGSYGDTVYALDTANGTARWTYRADGRVYVGPIVNQGLVYAGIGNEDVHIFALETWSGKLLWQSTTTISAMAHLLVADGVLYTSERIRDGMSIGFNLVGLDPQNGTIKWRYGGIETASLLASGHVLYAASTSGDLYAFEVLTHRLLWQQTVRSRAGAVSRMKLLGDELYVGFNGLGEYKDQFASIHAINAVTGEEDWSASVRWNVSTLDLA